MNVSDPAHEPIVQNLWLSRQADRNFLQGSREMTHEHITYLLGRHEQEIAAASAALNQAARVAHSELAYRYSVAVAQAGVGRQFAAQKA
jgi:hypothetical protein